MKFAAKYGFTLEAEDFAAKMKELSDDELQAVTGGGDSACGESFIAAVNMHRERRRIIAVSIRQRQSDNSRVRGERHS